MLYPVIWLFASSLKPSDEVLRNVTNLIPSSIHLENYAQGWAGFGGITFATFFKNSFIYAGLGTVIQVAASVVVGYSFARVKFRGKSIFFTIMLLTLMLPSEVLLIPQYIIFSQWGWLNTFLPLLVPRIGGSAFFIFMDICSVHWGRSRSTWTKPPRSMARGQWGIFRHVIFATALALAIITAMIFSLTGGRGTISWGR